MPEGASRIVLINDTSIARGGATTLSLELAHGLRRKGRAVTWFAGDKGVNHEFGEWGVEVRSVDGQQLLESIGTGFVNGIYNRRSLRVLKELIDEIDAPDVVYHVHGWAQILSPSIFEALRPVANRVVMTAHDFFLACPNGNFMIYPKSRQCELKPLSIECISTNCDKRNYPHKIWRIARQMTLNSLIDFNHSPYTVLAIQKGMLPYLVKGGVPETSIEVLGNPAAKFCEKRVEAEKNNEILYIGRLEHEKGADLLAAAAYSAGADLHIVGAGPAESKIRKAHPGARFAGWVPHETLGEALESARFLVMPSRCTEPFGLSAAEALGAGLPVMTSQSCLIGEEVRQLGMGDVVNVFDMTSFSERIREWMTNDALVKDMSEAAIKHSSKIGPDPEEWVDAHLEIYDRLIDDAMK